MSRFVHHKVWDYMTVTNKKNTKKELPVRPPKTRKKIEDIQEKLAWKKLWGE